MKININDQNSYGQINPNLHGQFIEFLGNCIDEGIWVGKDSKIPNIGGMRKGTVDALKKLAPPVVRWPGGCYADTYHWRDGIGPQKDRPISFNENFGTYQRDRHSFGTDEFMEFCELIGAQPWFNINMLSASVQEMKDWMEYCNRSEQTSLSNQRKDNGHAEPYAVKYWGIGNEVWGGGGSMTPEMYADKYREYASAMPTFQKSIFDQNPIYKIASGPDGNKPIERVKWTKDFLKAFSRYRQPGINAMDLHFYNWNIEHESDTPTDFGEDDWYRVINGAQELDQIINQQADLIKEGLQNIPQPESSLDHRLDRIDLVVGEWGNWHRTAFTAKPALKQQVTMRDAISTALMLDILQKNSDKVTMACVAQTINVLNALILTEGDQTILTPNYDVFMMYKAHRGNSALKIQTNQDQKNVYTFASKKDGEIILDAINANLNDQVKLTVELNKEIESISKDFLQSDRPTDFNSSDNPDLIRMQQTEVKDFSKGEITLELSPASVNVFHIKTID